MKLKIQAAWNDREEFKYIEPVNFCGYTKLELVDIFSPLGWDVDILTHQGTVSLFYENLEYAIYIMENKIDFSESYNLDLLESGGLDPSYKQPQPLIYTTYIHKVEKLIKTVEDIKKNTHLIVELMEQISLLKTRREAKLKFSSQRNFSGYSVEELKEQFEADGWKIDGRDWAMPDQNKYFLNLYANNWKHANRISIIRMYTGEVSISWVTTGSSTDETKQLIERMRRIGNTLEKLLKNSKQILKLVKILDSYIPKSYNASGESFESLKAFFEADGWRVLHKHDSTTKYPEGALTRVKNTLYMTVNDATSTQMWVCAIMLNDVDYRPGLVSYDIPKFKDDIYLLRTQLKPMLESTDTLKANSKKVFKILKKLDLMKTVTKMETAKFHSAATPFLWGYTAEELVATFEADGWHVYTDTFKPGHFGLMGRDGVIELYTEEGKRRKFNGEVSIAIGKNGLWQNVVKPTNPEHLYIYDKFMSLTSNIDDLVENSKKVLSLIKKLDVLRRAK